MNYDARNIKVGGGGFVVQDIWYMFRLKSINHMYLYCNKPECLKVLQGYVNVFLPVRLLKV